MNENARMQLITDKAIHLISRIFIPNYSYPNSYIFESRDFVAAMLVYKSCNFD